MSLGLSVIVRPSEVQLVHLNLIDQRRARNPELVRGPRPVPTVKLERLLDVRPLHLRQRLGLVPPLSPGARLAQVGGQVLDADLPRAARQDRKSTRLNS